MNIKNSRSAQSTGPRVVDWVFLRGLARESGHWGSFPQRFVEAIPHSRIHTLDLPGAGSFSGMRSFLTIQEITDFVREKLQQEDRYLRSEKLPPIEKAHLVAISLGGMVAADWLERYADDFVTCTLINSSFRGVSPIYKRLLFRSFPHIIKAFNASSSIHRELEILKMTSNRPQNYQVQAAIWAQVSDLRPMAKENFFRQLLAAARFSSTLKHPPCPVLVLNSLRDRLVSPSCSEEIARRWGAELRQHPTAGHDLPFDEPQWTLDRIKEFTQL